MHIEWTQILIAAITMLVTGFGVFAVMKDRIKRLGDDMNQKASAERVATLEATVKEMGDKVVYADTCERCRSKSDDRDHVFDQALVALGSRMDSGFTGLGSRIDTMMGLLLKKGD
jgi:hypothetical protein